MRRNPNSMRAKPQYGGGKLMCCTERSTGGPMESYIIHDGNLMGKRRRGETIEHFCWLNLVDYTKPREGHVAIEKHLE